MNNELLLTVMCVCVCVHARNILLCDFLLLSSFFSSVDDELDDDISDMNASKKLNFGGPNVGKVAN